MKLTVILLLAAALTACAGLDITPVSPDQVKSAHHGDARLDGYVVYAPMIVMELGMSEGTICSVGKPFLVPDLSSPFVVNTRTGLGSTSVVLSIKDGWLLTSVTNRSGNAAVERFLENLPTLLSKAMKTAGITAAKKAPTAECTPALYRVDVDNDKVFLTRLSVEST